jgi:hypothetical protein
MNVGTLNPALEPVVSPIPVSELLPWLVFGGLLMLLAIYFVGAEQGATSIPACMCMSSCDGRHLLGCH